MKTLKILKSLRVTEPGKNSERIGTTDNKSTNAIGVTPYAIYDL